MLAPQVSWKPQSTRANPVPRSGRGYHHPNGISYEMRQKTTHHEKDFLWCKILIVFSLTDTISLQIRFPSLGSIEVVWYNQQKAAA